jgi:hypothetical protein
MKALDERMTEVRQTDGIAMKDYLRLLAIHFQRCKSEKVSALNLFLLK